MPFYIRKSFRAGPLRFNLSRSGIGVSGGVTGARLGLRPDGQVYTHAGRYGLYHRQNLGRVGGGRRRRRSGHRPEGRPSTVHGREEHFVDTGVTFPVGPVYDPREQGPPLEIAIPRPPRAAGWWAAAVVVATASVVLHVREAGPGPVVGAGAAALVLAFLAWRTHRRARRQLLFERSLLAAGSDDPAVSAPARGRVQAMLAAGEIPRSLAQRLAPAVYADRAGEAMFDQIVSDREAEALEWIATVLHVDPEVARQVKVDAFRTTFLAMVADFDFSEDEERRVDALRRKLGLDEEDLVEERAVADRLVELRQLREGTLPRLATTQKLSGDEVCHFEGPARRLKSRVLDRFQRDRVKHVVRGFTIDAEGVLLITDRRLILRHRGSTEVRIRDVVGLEVDLDQNLLVVVRDGVKTPLYLTLPGADRAGAILAHVAGV